MSRRPKIKDVAEELGVSPATVSRALSGSGLVAEPTLSRIRDTAQRLGYRPNVNARSLRTQRSMAVLLVVRDVGNPFYLEVLKGIEASARAADYSVLMGNSENDPGREAEYFDMLRDGHADGMILMTGKLPAGAEQIEGLPVVVALEMIEDTSLPHVQIDNEAAAAIAVSHLIQLGHERIAHISGPIPEIMSMKRRAGFLTAMEDAGLDVPPDYVERGDYLLKSGRECCRRLLDLPEPPTAIFAANDEMAFGAIHELHRRGLDVPRDVSVVGFDDIYLSEVFYPPLTTISQPRAAIGRQAMELLLGIVAGGALDPGPLVLPTTLKIRETTAAPAVASHTGPRPEERGAKPDQSKEQRKAHTRSTA